LFGGRAGEEMERLKDDGLSPGNGLATASKWVKPLNPSWQRGCSSFVIQYF